MLPIIAAVLLAAKVPDAQAAAGAIRRRLGRGGATAVPAGFPPHHDRVRPSRTLIRAIHLRYGRVKWLAAGRAGDLRQALSESGFGKDQR